MKCILGLIAMVRSMNDLPCPDKNETVGKEDFRELQKFSAHNNQLSKVS